MSQHQQVIDVMDENGGYATLGFLYREVDVAKWATRTPFKTINRIVQDDRFFFRIKPGLWALKSRRNEVLEFLEIEKAGAKQLETFNHSYFQGLLVEVGNMKGFQTFVPNQDKNKSFLGKKLGEVSTLETIHQFTYEVLVKRAKTVDAIWFNQRNMPTAFFEVEHSTDIFNSLIKFSDLSDFYSTFCIVADIARRREFDQKISSQVFSPIKNRISFMSYDQLSAVHSNTYKLSSAKEEFGFLRG
ncbi:MAG: hypothetical protein HOP17_03100 [Acidobacteria bacterium]|nr:hypothetical protein [Acidobacteriota bacterium]